MTSDPELRAYLEDAARWDRDRQRLTERNARFGWWTAATGGLCVIALALALMGLMPLKRVEPFVIRVDNTSGVIDVVPTGNATLTLPETVTRYLLAHYVTVCERFNLVTAESDYEECGALQGPQRNQTWASLWARSNPSSPLNEHQDGSSVRARVTAISFFKRGTGVNDLAQVRYVRGERQSASAPERFTHWIANIQYGYSTPSQDPRQRAWNPMGFKVIEFQAEPEAIVSPRPG